MDFSHKPGTADHKPITIQACGGRKTIVRAFLLAVIIAALHFLFVFFNGSSVCEKAGNCAFSFRGGGVVTFKALPPLSTSYTSSALKPRYNFKSYEEYIQLQLNKTLNPKLRKVWTSRDWRRKVDVFSSLFQELMRKNLLKPEYKALCVGARVGQEVLALKEIGVQDAIGMDLVPHPPLVVQGDMHKQPFGNNTFDFEFSNVFDHALLPALFVSEIERTLKPSGSAVIHVSLKRRGDKYSANDLFSLDALIRLFKNSEVVHIREVDAFGLDTEIVFKKRNLSEKKVPGHGFFTGGGAVRQSDSLKSVNAQALSANCPIPKVEQSIIDNAESLVSEKSQKPLIRLKQNATGIKYLPSFKDISSRRRYVYIDVGARNYASSIGDWFQKKYPKQNQAFYIYAIEADQSFATDYKKRKHVELLPFAAWVKNESLSLGTGEDQPTDVQEEGSSPANGAPRSPRNRVKKVQGFNFAGWLKQTVSVDDFVVMKMGIGRMEFDLLPKMFETGAVCLVDELFLDCHHNGRQRDGSKKTSQHERDEGECLTLLKALRRTGVLAHQWGW